MLQKSLLVTHVLKLLLPLQKLRLRKSAKKLLLKRQALQNNMFTGLAGKTTNLNLWRQNFQLMKVLFFFKYTLVIPYLYVILFAKVF